MLSQMTLNKMLIGMSIGLQIERIFKRYENKCISNDVWMEYGTNR